MNRSAYLVGGGEFLDAASEPDSRVLSMLRGRKVAILPTAAAHEHPRIAARNGVEHFERLGSDPFAVMIIDGAGANDRELCSQLSGADLIYMTGGDPAYLVEVLRDSAALEVMRESWKAGAVLAGSSAGAMALGPVLGMPRFGWTEALGFVDVVTVPHADEVGREVLDQVARSIGRERTVVAIPASTGALVTGDTLEAMGPDAISLLAGGDWRTVDVGERVELR